MMSNSNIGLAAGARSAVGLDDGGADLLALTELLPVAIIPLTALAGGFGLRLAGDDSAHVRMLAEAASSRPLPPILVQRSSSKVIDGMHRVAAAKLRRDTAVSARLVDCTDAEALVLAMRSNSLHGLPLTRGDRVKGARGILAAHPDWSDRTVAQVAGMSAKAVASLRESAGLAAQAQVRRLGLDGKWRPVNGAEGRRQVTEFLAAHPDASLREAARMAGVSLGTVHDARRQLRVSADTGTDSSTVDGQRESPGRPALTGTSRSGPARQRVAASDAQPSLPMIMTKLARDPSLRYTDGGRAFLRWMAQHAMQPGEWRNISDAIPEHRLRDVSKAAAVMSEEWRQLSVLLDSRLKEADSS